MRSLHDRLVIAHALFACLAGLFVIPAAVLIGRFQRSNPQWWQTHAILNVAGVLLIVVAFALGMASSGPAIGGDDSDLHHKLGLAVFLLLLLQLIFGFVAHYVFRPVQGDGTRKASCQLPSFGHWSRLSTTARSFRAWHILFGVCTMGMLYWQMWNGLSKEWNSMSDDMSKTPQSVQVIYWIVVAIPLLAYVYHVGNESLQATEELPSKHADGVAI